MDGQGQPRCRMTNKDGKPCSAKPRKETDLCPWHTPEIAAARGDASRRGGLGRSNKARLAKTLPRADLSAAELVGLLGGVYLEIIAGEREASQGPSLASLARTMLEVRRVADLEGKLAAIEQRMGDLAERVGAS